MIAEPCDGPPVLQDAARAQTIMAVDDSHTYQTTLKPNFLQVITWNCHSHKCFVAEGLAGSALPAAALQLIQ
jgi:hypothetical protein